MITMTSTRALLDKLRITDVNPGACYGPDRWISDPHGRELVSHNPTTGEAIAKIVQADAETYDKVVAEASAAFLKWRMVPAPKRGEVVRDLGNALRELKEPLGDLVSLEMGKIRAEGHGEVQEMIDVCDFAVGLSRQLYGLTMQSERPAHRMMEQWHPLGPVGVITAFNFPVAVWAWNSAIASVCGDPVIWKPAGPVPLCAIAVQHVANRVMADHKLSGVFTLVIGPGRSVGERMLGDARVPLISFTGSTETGSKVGETAGRMHKRLSLEMGGKNAQIVLDDAKLDLALDGVLWGAFGTTGQRCTATSRLILHEKIYDKFLAELLPRVQKLRLGDGLDPKVDVGPCVNEGQRKTVQSYVEIGKSEGAKESTLNLSPAKGSCTRPRTFPGSP